MSDSTQQAPPADSSDPFQTMFRMSTTAGLGSGNYLAISGLAVAAIFLGVASAAVLFDEPALLLIPLASIVCGILALKSIASSNGTQTGRELAVVGLVLALGFGGYAGYGTVHGAIRNRADEAALSSLIHDFGEKLKAGKYHDAYLMCDPDFRGLVPEAYFSGLWQTVVHASIRGQMTTMDWNGRLKFEPSAVTGVYQSEGMAVAKFPGYEPLRINFLFSQVDGKWMIDQIPQVFDPAKLPSAPKPMGPPAPGARQ